MYTVQFRSPGKRIPVTIFTDPFRVWCGFCKSGNCKHIERLVDVADKREKSAHFKDFDTISGKLLSYLNEQATVLDKQAKDLEAQHTAVISKEVIQKQVDEATKKLKADLEVEYQRRERQAREEARLQAARSNATANARRLVADGYVPPLPPKPAPPEKKEPVVEGNRISLLELD